MVGQRVAPERPGFIVGKQLIPAAAPHIVISRADGLPRGDQPRVVPKQIGSERLVSDLPDPAAGLRQHHNANKAVLYIDSAKPGKARSGIDSDVFHHSTARSPSEYPGSFRFAFEKWSFYREWNRFFYLGLRLRSRMLADCRPKNFFRPIRCI